MLYGLQTTYAPSTNGIKECRRFECSRAGVRNAVIFVSVSGSNIVLIRYSYSHRIFDLRLDRRSSPSAASQKSRAACSSEGDTRGPVECAWIC